VAARGERLALVHEVTVVGSARDDAEGRLGFDAETQGRSRPLRLRLANDCLLDCLLVPTKHRKRLDTGLHAAHAVFGAVRR